MVKRGGFGVTGINCRRNFRLRRVTRPDPSTRIAYWSNCLTAMTTPVLSHLRGCGPPGFEYGHDLLQRAVAVSLCAL